MGLESSSCCGEETVDGEVGSDAVYVRTSKSNSQHHWVVCKGISLTSFVDKEGMVHFLKVSPEISSTLQLISQSKKKNTYRCIQSRKKISWLNFKTITILPHSGTINLIDKPLILRMFRDYVKDLSSLGSLGKIKMIFLPVNLFQLVIIKAANQKKKTLF